MTDESPRCAVTAERAVRTTPSSFERLFEASPAQAFADGADPFSMGLRPAAPPETK